MRVRRAAKLFTRQGTSNLQRCVGEAVAVVENTDAMETDAAEMLAEMARATEEEAVQALVAEMARATEEEAVQALVAEMVRATKEEAAAQALLADAARETKQEAVPATR